MSAELFLPVLTLVLAPITAAVTWWLSRRKEVAVTHATVAEGASTAVATILEVMKELKHEIAELTNEAEILRRENERLRRLVAELEHKIQQIMKGLPT